jgi:hypothetical protein
MTNYLLYFFGISTLVAGIYIFLLSFGIYKPKKTENKESVIEKYGTLFKIISIIMILRGGYNLINPNPDRYKISQNKTENNTEWTSESREILIENCLRDSGEMAINYPSIMKEYAECTADKVMSEYNQKEYLEITNKSFEEQKPILMPLIKDCLAEMNRKVNSVDLENKNVR